jgi:hypothetical protein
VPDTTGTVNPFEAVKICGHAGNKRREKENIFHFFVKSDLQRKYILHLFEFQVRQPAAKLQPGYLVAQQLAGNTQTSCRASHVAIGLLQGTEDHFFLQRRERGAQIEIFGHGRYWFVRM